MISAEDTAAAYFQRGLEAIRRGAFAEAEAQVKAGLKLDPNSPAGHDLLGITYDGLKQPGEAEQAFRHALKLNPRFVPAHNDLGRSLYQRRMTQAAEQEFRTVLLIDPRNFTATYNLGLLARDARRYPEAIRYLEKAHQIFPSDAPTLLALTSACLGGDKREQAVSAASQLVSLNSSDPQIRFSLGTLFLEWKQYNEAAEHLERARITAPRNFELLHNLGQAYNHLKKYSEAEDAFLQALSFRGDSVETLYQLAVVYAQSGHPDQAIQILVRARQLAPKSPDVLLLLGRECTEEGFVDDAIEVLQECVRIDPGKIEPHLLLGEALAAKKLFPQAVKEYEIVVGLEPSNPQCRVLLGRTLRYMGQYPEAERSLHQALRLDPANVQAAYYLGLVASDQSDYPSAQRWFDLALKSDPKHLGALYEMAVACMRTNEDLRARDYLQRARVVAPTFSQVHYRLSVVYQRLKEPELAAEARALFKKYEQLDVEKRKYFPYGVLEFVQQTQDLPQNQRLERYRQELLKTEKLKPDDLNLLLMLVQVNFGLGLKQEAFQRLEKISSLQPDNLQVRLRSASLLTAFKCYPEALQQLETLVEKQPDSSQVRFALAALYLQMQHTAEASKVLNAVASSENSAAYHNLLGRILIRQESPVKALKHLQKAVDLEPANEEYLADLALELALAGELSEAQHLLERAKAKFPAGGRIRFAEGIWHQLSEHKTEALAAFRQAADLSWQWEVPHLAQGNLLLQSGSTGEALELMEQAVALFPGSPWPHWLRGLAFLKNPQTGSSQAISEIRQSLSLASNRPDILPALLVSSLQRRDCKSAREIWGKMTTFGLALELDPVQWCGSEQDTPPAGLALPAKIASQYSGLRWLLDLATSSFHQQ